MRLLLVDDDLSSLEGGAMLLRSAGYHVDETGTGRDAVRLLLSNKFDLALIDLRLPDMSGLDVVQAVRDRGLVVRWILFSGFMDFEAAREAGRLGAIRTLSLPIGVPRI
jgi:DNA-binding NtrC family response regulator